MRSLRLRVLPSRARCEGLLPLVLESPDPFDRAGGLEDATGREPVGLGHLAGRLVDLTKPGAARSSSLSWSSKKGPYQP